MHLIRSRRFDAAGETIVEVLIAVAVLSAVLGSSYAVANRSLQMGIKARERTEALKLIEGQVEMLKNQAYKATTATDVTNFNNSYKDPATKKGYCMYRDASGAIVQQYNKALKPANLVVSPTDYADKCRMDATGTPSTAEEARYYVNIFYDAQATDSKSQFQIWVKWDSATGTPDQSVIYYRIRSS